MGFLWDVVFIAIWVTSPAGLFGHLIGGQTSVENQLKLRGQGFGNPVSLSSATFVGPCLIPSSSKYRFIP